MRPVGPTSPPMKQWRPVSAIASRSSRTPSLLSRSASATSRPNSGRRSTQLLKVFVSISSAPASSLSRYIWRTASGLLRLYPSQHVPASSGTLSWNQVPVALSASIGRWWARARRSRKVSLVCIGYSLASGTSPNRPVRVFSGRIAPLSSTSIGGSVAPAASARNTIACSSSGQSRYPGPIRRVRR